MDNFRYMLSEENTRFVFQLVIQNIEDIFTIGARSKVSKSTNSSAI